MVTMSDVIDGNNDSGMDLFDKMSLMENATARLIKSQEEQQEEKQAAVNQTGNDKSNESQDSITGKELRKVCMSHRFVF